MVFKVDLIRPDDLLNLHIEGVNLQVNPSSGEQATITFEDLAKPAYLVVQFPPQTIAERVFFETNADTKKPVGADPAMQARIDRDAAAASDPLLAPGKVAVRLGGPSRLVFRVPAEMRIPFSIAGLLDWSALDLVVPFLANIPAGSVPPVLSVVAIRPPSALETDIELPYRLHISPDSSSRWEHAIAQVSHQGRTELWHTRLANEQKDRVQPNSDKSIPLRAVWSPDYDASGNVPAPGNFGPLGALGAMSPADRHQIVVLTSAFQGYAQSAQQAYTPLPFYASQLMLSPLGGWLRSVGSWSPPYRAKPKKSASPLQGIEVLNLPLLFENMNGDRQPLPLPSSSSPAQRSAQTPERSVTKALSPVSSKSTGTPVLTPAGTSSDTSTGSPSVSQSTVTQIKSLTPLKPLEFGDLGAIASPDLNSIILRPQYDLGQQLDLSQWAHTASQGRDHYVRIVYEGRFKPFGHRGALIKVTERRFETLPKSSAPVAFLRQYMYMVVREPLKNYAQEGLPRDGRGMPLKQIRLTTLVTPKIDYPYAGAPAITDRSFWIQVSGQDFRFHAVGTDIAGNPVDFTIPLIFVPNSEQNLAAVETAYNQPANSKRRSALVPGQKVAFAVPGSGKDNTSFATEALNFINEGSSKAEFFRPKLFKADVRIPAVEQLVGSGTVSSIQMLADYVTGGGFENAANATGSFATIVNETATGVLEAAVAGVKFSAEQAGGFATPNLDITTLTRNLGPLGGKVADALTDKFDPSAVFGKGLAKIFGSFDLADLIPVEGSAAKNAPKMQIRRDGTTAIAELDWKPAVREINLTIIKFTPTKDKTVLDVHGVFKKSLTGAVADSFLLTGKLNDFEIFFLNVVQINFDLFSFTAQNGKKTDIKVNLNKAAPVAFIGDLDFVQELQKLIPPGVFGDGVSIDLIQAPLGIKAALSIGLPPVSVGVFALQNILFAAGLTIPFLEGKPVFDFAFARRDTPFMLTISLFGGGGFFRLEVDPDGIRLLEAAFEFGAAAAINIGVASGEVHIMAGIYFKMEKRKLEGIADEKLVSLLSGFLRCGGKLSVLGLITISVEFNLSFTYDSGTQKASGRATLTVTIDVLLFSKSIELTVERSFGSKGSDPTFGQMMDSPVVWNEYAMAFA